jgi:hypothetical protein
MLEMLEDAAPCGSSGPRRRGVRRQQEEDGRTGQAAVPDIDHGLAVVRPRLLEPDIRVRGAAQAFCQSPGQVPFGRRVTDTQVEHELSG